MSLNQDFRLPSRVISLSAVKIDDDRHRAKPLVTSRSLLSHWHVADMMRDDQRICGDADAVGGDALSWPRSIATLPASRAA